MPKILQCKAKSNRRILAIALLVLVLLCKVTPGHCVVSVHTCKRNAYLTF